MIVHNRLKHTEGQVALLSVWLLNIFNATARLTRGVSKYGVGDWVQVGGTMP